MEVRERERKEMNSSGDRESENYTTGKKNYEAYKSRQNGRIMQHFVFLFILSLFNVNLCHKLLSMHKKEIYKLQ
jgi:hypothetical protein